MSSENKWPRVIGTRAPSSELESLAREYTEAALNAIIRVMEKTRDERTRLRIARMLRERGWGKPTQTFVNAGDDNDSHNPPAA
jgi:hypothetical protein